MSGPVFTRAGTWGGRMSNPPQNIELLLLKTKQLVAWGKFFHAPGKTQTKRNLENP